MKRNLPGVGKAKQGAVLTIEPDVCMGYINPRLKKPLLPEVMEADIGLFCINAAMES